MGIRLPLWSQNILFLCLAGEENTGVHTTVDAAGNIGVQTIANHQSLLGSEAGDFKAKLYDLFAGLAQIDGLFVCGGGDHVADGTAIGDKAEVDGAAQIRVGAVERNILGE